MSDAATAVQPDANKVFTSDKGRVEWEVRAPDVLLARYSGRGTAPIFEYMSEVIARAAVKCPQHCFADLSQMPDFDPEFRDGWASWFRTNRKNVASLHVLQKSILVSVALSVINIATGGLLKNYRDPQEFERALQAQAQASSRK